MQVPRDARAFGFLRLEQPAALVGERFFCVLARRNVLDGAAQPYDVTCGSALHLSARRHPSAGPVGADHLQKEFVGFARLKARVDRSAQSVPTLETVELWVSFVAHG